jgi:hypothetical protein
MVFYVFKFEISNYNGALYVIRSIHSHSLILFYSVNSEYVTAVSCT